MTQKKSTVKVTARTTRSLACYTAVFRVVKQCSSPLRDGTENGCVAGYSKSRGQTIDKQRLFLIITIDMLSFRALLSFLSHYCACHIQAMQLRLVSSRTGRRGVISDLDCNFKILPLSMLGGNEPRPPEERRISERGTKGRFFFTVSTDLGFFSPFIGQWSH